MQCSVAALAPAATICVHCHAVLGGDARAVRTVVVGASIEVSPTPCVDCATEIEALEIVFLLARRNTGACAIPLDAIPKWQALRALALGWITKLDGPLMFAPTGIVATKIGA